MYIRRINPDDNHLEVAHLIYGTDPYIYPFWLHDVPDKIGSISRLIDVRGSVFYRDNIYVAVADDHIVGVMVYLHAGGDYSYDYNWERQNHSNFSYAYEKYFRPTIAQAQMSSADTAVILNVCIAFDQRGKGYGKQMFHQVAIALCDNGFSRLLFDCLVENQTALKTYLGVGCEIVEKGYGFNGFDPSRPPRVVFLEHRF